MENLRKRLICVNNFDELSELLYLDENVNEAKHILDSIDSKTNAKNILSSFIINNCPEEIIGENNIHLNRNLINSAKNLIFSDELSEFKDNLKIYCKLFSEWKIADSKLIIDSLSREYFTTSLKIINTPSANIEQKVIYSAYNNKIIQYANKLVGSEGSNILMSFNPVQEFYHELNFKFTDEYFKILTDEFDCDIFTKFYESIDFLKMYFSELEVENDIVVATFNKEFFKTIIENNSYSNDDIKFFSSKAFKIIRNLQSAKYHNLLDSYSFEVASNSTYLPDIVKNLLKLTIQLSNDIEELVKN
jgi:hypothetical protein